MRIALFGGSGATGRRICQVALEAGHTVRGLVRPGSHLFETGSVEEVEGLLADDAAVARTLSDTDAAVLAFGPRAPFSDIFCAEATRRIVAHARRLGVTRLVCLTGAMIGEYRQNRSWAMERMAWLYRRRLPESARDRAEQEAVVIGSGVEWTLAKPPRLSEGGRSGRFQAGPRVRVGLLSHVSRLDVAYFIIDELEERRYVRTAVFLRG